MQLYTEFLLLNNQIINCFLKSKEQMNEMNNYDVYVYTCTITSVICVFKCPIKRSPYVHILVSII